MSKENREINAMGDSHEKPKTNGDIKFFLFLGVCAFLMFIISLSSVVSNAPIFKEAHYHILNKHKATVEASYNAEKNKFTLKRVSVPNEGSYSVQLWQDRVYIKDNTPPMRGKSSLPSEIFMVEKTPNGFEWFCQRAKGKVPVEQC